MLGSDPKTSIHQFCNNFMLKSFARYILPSFLVVIGTGVLHAQQPPSQTIQVDRTSKHFDAPRTELAPVMDGVIDGDPAWLNARLIDDLYQIRPLEYLPASEKTEFLVMYDADNLYVAAKFYYQNKEDIVANILRQGESTFSDDRVGLILDPFGDTRRGYLFNLNSNSVRSESLFVSTSRFQPDWEGIWEAQSQITDYGWSGEIRIPFKTLSFDPNATTWGINFRRDMEKNPNVSVGTPRIRP